MNSVEEYLRESIKAFRRSGGQAPLMYEFVLKHGRTWKPVPKLQREFRVYRGPIKECFRNAALAALADRCLTYVEGYAASIIPIAHAWCVTARGEVVELTWSKAADSYYGVPFRKEFLKRELIRNGSYGLIDQWTNNWPLLRGKYPREEWLQTKGQK